MTIYTNDFTDIHIQQDTTIIDTFTTGTGTKTICVDGGVSVTYLVIMQEQCELDLRIESSGVGAEITVKGLLLAKNGSNMRLNAHAHLMHDQATADIHLVSFLQDGSVTEVDGGVDLHEGCSKISGHLLEENIILGENVQIKALPMLDVRSSDVSASHGCRIQKLDEKKLFYIRSRGLNKQQAEELMIKGYFEQMFAPVQGGDETIVVKRLEEECLEYLLG